MKLTAAVIISLPKYLLGLKVGCANGSASVDPKCAKVAACQMCHA